MKFFINLEKYFFFYILENCINRETTKSKKSRCFECKCLKWSLINIQTFYIFCLFSSIHFIRAHYCENYLIPQLKNEEKSHFINAPPFKFERPPFCDGFLTAKIIGFKFMENVVRNFCLVVRIIW